MFRIVLDLGVKVTFGCDALDSEDFGLCLLGGELDIGDGTGRGFDAWRRRERVGLEMCGVDSFNS